MRRLGIAGAFSALILALAGPVSAVKPIGGCPNASFQRMTLEAFIELEAELGVPGEVLETLPAVLDAIDANDDGHVCVKDVPDTPGHNGPFLFNLVDNVSHP